MLTIVTVFGKTRDKKVDLGLDLNIVYCVISVNLVFLGSFIVGNVEIKELQTFLIIFGIHRVFGVDSTQTQVEYYFCN